MECPPVLLLMFKRPNHSRQVFDKIRQAKPKKLFLASDGARPGRLEEKRLVSECRAIQDLVDWDCEVDTLYQESNLGSWNAIPQAITWFFANVDRGIVLEDDCLPDESFFEYCSILLEMYKSNEKVWWINGSNLGFDKANYAHDYAFSSYPLSWGWASWSEVWSKHDQSMKEWQHDRSRIQILDSKPFLTRNYWKLVFNWASITPNWDYRLKYSCIRNNGVAISPSVNLISNVGVGDSAAVHTRKANDQRGFIPTETILPLRKHPKSLGSSNSIDKFLEKKLYKISILTMMQFYSAVKTPRFYRLLRKLLR